MKNAFIFFCLFLIFGLDASISTGQPSIQEKISLGSETNQPSLIELPNGGYYITGTNTGQEFHYPFLINLDATGNISWTKNFSYPCSSLNTPSVKTKDGGIAFISIGVIWGQVPYRYLQLVKLSSLGETEWVRGVTGSDFLLLSLIQVSDNGYIITSARSKGVNPIVTKLDSAGKLQWSRRMSDQGQAQAASNIIESPDSAYVIVLDPAVGKSIELAKISRSGSLLWSRRDSVLLLSPRIASLHDSGFVLCGNIPSADSHHSDLCVCRYDKNGKRQWANTYGNSQDILFGSCVTEMVGGEVVVIGTRANKMLFMQLDALGRLVRAKDMSYPSIDFQSIAAVPTQEGGIAVTATSIDPPTEQGILFVRLDHLLTSECNFNEEIINTTQLSKSEEASFTDSLVEIVDTQYTVKEFTSSSLDFTLSHLCDSRVPLSQHDISQMVVLSPNPARHGEVVSLHLDPESSKKMHTLQIYNSLGQLVMRYEISKESSQNEIPLDVSKLGPGTYEVRILDNVDGTLSVMSKFVKLK